MYSSYSVDVSCCLVSWLTLYISLTCHCTASIQSQAKLTTVIIKAVPLTTKELRQKKSELRVERRRVKMGGDERAVAAPLLQQQQDGGGGDGERRRRRWWWGWWDGEEAAGQLAFAAPMVATSMAYYAIPLVSVMYAGRLGELELAGATLGNSWGTVTGIALMVITFHPIPFDSFIYTGLHHLKIISFLRFSNLIIDPFVNLINHLLRLRWPEMLAWPEAHRPMVSLLVSLFSFLDFFLNNKKKGMKR